MNTTKTGQTLQIQPFTSIPTRIPRYVDGKFTGETYKTEQNLFRSMEGGARLHFWNHPDLRPHNHPWEWIDCKIGFGWYRAIEFHPDGNGSYIEKEVTLHAGDPEHRILHNVFHQIIDVQQGTLSVMTFGAQIGDGKQWGHLVKDNNIYRYEHNTNTSTHTPDFMEAFRHLNPHIPRPEGWVDPYADL